MSKLGELRSNLKVAEDYYRTAQGSLDTSPLEVILAKEQLKQARFRYDAECRKYVEVNVFGNFIEDEIENV